MYSHRLFIVITVFSLLTLPFLSSGMSSFKPHRVYVCYKVLDGDTVLLKRGEQSIRVRLASIDAPEKNQIAYSGESIGLWSTKFLKDICQGRRVKLEVVGIDIYGRVIGNIYLKQKNLSLVMVRSGMAVAYGYKISWIYKVSEHQARIKRLGVWRTEGFIAPRLFRRQKKASQ